MLVLLRKNVCWIGCTIVTLLLWQEMHRLLRRGQHMRLSNPDPEMLMDSRLIQKQNIICTSTF